MATMPPTATPPEEELLVRVARAMVEQRQDTAEPDIKDAEAEPLLQPSASPTPKPSPTPKAERRSLQVQAAEALARGDDQTYQRLVRVAREMATASRATPAGSGEGLGLSVSLLLSGGTTDKLPIGERAAAVAAARKRGGVSGTGFVPMNDRQQIKFTDFMDLRSKAMRLRDLLAKPEVVSKLGPAMGRWTGLTKELPVIGQSTEVKEAFDMFKNLSDAELRRRSGSAISPGEYMRILGFTVDPTKQVDSNMTNVNQMISTLDSALKTLGATNLPAAAGTPGASPNVQRILDLMKARNAGQ